MKNILKQVVIHKDERIDVAGFGNYSIETLALVILEGSAGTSYPYLTDCLRERLEELNSVSFSWRHENGGDRD